MGTAVDDSHEINLGNDDEVMEDAEGSDAAAPQQAGAGAAAGRKVRAPPTLHLAGNEYTQDSFWYHRILFTQRAAEHAACPW